MTTFAYRLIRWQKQHGRHDLPWQGQGAYRVWLSEIMLQQTQVVTVTPYYLRFVASFPDIAALAAATEDQVLAHWSGLGYYARGRNLLKAARIIVDRYHGEFPRKIEDIAGLPGVGRSTAAAVCALAFRERRAILDGNVKRVLARWCGIEGWSGGKTVEDKIWRQAEALLPHHEVDVYTQAMMDMGATVCTRSKPKCVLCPVQADCVALQSERIAELPTPRPKKSVPERQAVFLLLMHGKDILLEKRPGTGVWGGMWCPPQFADEGAAREWFGRSGMEAFAGQRLAAFTHTFTHFRLHITPLRIDLARKPPRTGPQEGMWLTVDEALGAAIPAPVRTMLGTISREGLREAV